MAQLAPLQTYYCTHALAPLMCITGTMPISVNALSITAPEVTDLLPTRNDPGSVILCRMDNGAVFRLFGLTLPGHSNWYRFHGTGGANGNHPAVRVISVPSKYASGTTRGIVQDRYPNRTDLCPHVGLNMANLRNRPDTVGEIFGRNYEFANAIRSGKPPIPGCLIAG